MQISIFGQKPRWAALYALTGLFALLLVTVLLWRTLHEAGGTNSYALVADAFLHGRPWVTDCFDSDCSVREGRTFIVFPPLPGIVAIPLVAVGGVKTAGFMLVNMLALVASLWLWRRILTKLGLDNTRQFWVLTALAFASPLFYVSLRGDGIWFFAQALAFPLVSAAIHETLVGRLVMAGAALALALLCRQLSVFYAPILLLLTFRDEDPLLRINRERIGAVLRLGAPIAVGLGCYFAYNVWRFGNPLDTGYGTIDFAPGFLKQRFEAFGTWNQAYALFNGAYLLLQGFHVDFAEPLKVRFSGLDNAGTSILAASPWLLFLFFAPARRLTFACTAMIVAFSAALLFYHSNGFSQYNTQRYALDWFPAALLMLALALRRQRLGAFPLLVVWGMALNVATVAILAITHGG